MYKVQQDSKLLPGSIEPSNKPVKKITREKRKGGSNTNDEQSPAKRQKQMGQTAEEEHGMGRNAQKVPEPNEAKEVKTKVEKADSTPGRQSKESDSRKPKYTDQCTAFLSNLNAKASVQSLWLFQIH